MEIEASLLLESRKTERGRTVIGLPSSQPLREEDKRARPPGTATSCLLSPRQCPGNKLTLGAYRFLVPVPDRPGPPFPDYLPLSVTPLKKMK